MRPMQAYIASENPDTGEVEVLTLGNSTVQQAWIFTDYLNENPVNDWSGDTPAVIMMAESPDHVLDYLQTSFQAPRQRGAVFVNLGGMDIKGPAPRFGC